MPMAIDTSKKIFSSLEQKVETYVWWLSVTEIISYSDYILQVYAEPKNKTK